MAYKRLWLLVEGNDEERFFESENIKRLFANKYDFVRTWRYAAEPPRRIRSFIKSIVAMNSDYYFLKDLNDSPCVTARIESLGKKFGQTLDKSSLVIVVKEIEGWYLAGLDDKSCKELTLETFSNTDDIAKENFNSLIPKKFASRIDFMAEVLKRFSVETARQKNKSIQYFMAKLQANLKKGLT
jgi:hypothetical protein